MMTIYKKWYYSARMRIFNEQPRFPNGNGSAAA